ncbi:hypothetical protein NC652_020716 [Populus alba x Populus x berolinensis]|uniref:Uncharacterized protein n=1 Tax=Populus alba x Populus x berolinensis TaxID=444605 RepID=A0AAD6MMH0_9ROSI|nr:hypothetical protein NC652_020716 [Populus alba x Populus x berolinensis]KAJ6987315.1 hypothetical protein NC653_020532 [Populus alba x Populus x berolinensis]
MVALGSCLWSSVICLHSIPVKKLVSCQPP